MNFTKGEISEWKLRLIAFATESGPLIAVFDVCDMQTRSAREGDKPEQLFQNFTLGEIHQRFFPVSGYRFFYYALGKVSSRIHAPRERIQSRRARLKASQAAADLI